ncbi:hypothetical protein EUGRSUZ_L01225 [Eucalyptus grandis]|uniref:Cullin family profile domain-containing protein n=1 Tax=Eucalyptus grandis TaxID=71139 RepID=A0A058ZTN3_EUCGR|nr:hypothetical protein EUGRSUZ_L01225 [Eucalyptus grandis]
MLRELVKRWGNYKVMVRWLSRFFYYLDRYFIARRSLLPLKEVYQEVKVKVRDAVISLIDQEREGKQIDQALLKNILDLFMEIGTGQMDYYKEDFEPALIKYSAAYYSRKASSWILEDSCPDYMLKAEEYLKREEDRVSHYLHSSSEPKLLEKVQHELLSVYASKLLEKEDSGCRVLLGNDKGEDLSRMFRLFSKIPKGLDPVANIFQQHVTATGTVLVKQVEDAAGSKANKKYVVGLQQQSIDLAHCWQDFVREVIELHDKYEAYVNDCFQNHALFNKAFKMAFETLCDKGVGGSSMAELVATFCNDILRKRSKKLSDIEETLEKVIKLLSYISGKDLFAGFYWKKLATRLLFDNSANDDHERCMLMKLKQQCGPQFTLKMEDMVDANPGIDLKVTTLNTDFWPSYKSFDLNLPAEVQKGVEVFREFYQTKMKKRKLAWIYSLGTCNIIGKFEPKTMELIVTTYQASALLLFNSSDRLTYSAIMTRLNLTDDDVVRILHSLSCAKYRILNKEPNTKSIAPTDHFEFNSKFTNKMRRIRIPLPPVDEKKKVIEDVDRDRDTQLMLNCAYHEASKDLRYQQLVWECKEQLCRIFKPDLEAIKKRIEILITKDYMVRDKDNAILLRYVP